MILRGGRSCQCLAVIPRHPLRWVPLQLLGVPQQLGQIIKRIGPVQFAGMDQTHEQIAYSGAIQRLVNEGEKARATMRAMGIDFHTATGEMKPTSEILVEISEGLNKLPEGFQRDAAAMDLFKKVGVEAIPFMTELNENLRVAHEQGFGPTEEDIRRFSEYQREVTVLETKWDSLVRKLKEGLVVTVTWVGKGVDWFLNNISTAGDDEREHREEIQAPQDAAQIRAAGGYGASMSISGHRKEVADLERRAPDIMKNRDATLKRIEDLRAEQQRLTVSFRQSCVMASLEASREYRWFCFGVSSSQGSALV